MSITLTVNDIRNAASHNADNTYFYVEINHPDFGWIPYTLDPADTDMTIDNTVLRTLIGSDFTPYTAPTQAEIDAETAQSVRNERDRRLSSEVDPIVTNPLRWADLTTEKQNEWTQYRTDLLNVPQQAGFPNTINWPTKPE
jgi:hypothetical protein